MTDDEKNSLLNKDNLTQPIQMKLSHKQNFCSLFFSQLFKSSINFEHFQKKKMPLIADVFPKLPTPNNVDRSMPQKSCFIGPFKKQHSKRVKTLLKSGR